MLGCKLSSLFGEAPVVLSRIRALVHKNDDFRDEQLPEITRFRREDNEMPQIAIAGNH